ncbi:MAG: DUF5995 family protein [Actinomycetota bacterium]
MAPIQTLDRALAELDRIVEVTRAEGSRLGIFPAMYREVTRAIHRAVREGGLFDDDARLERLASVFAGRYVEAFDRYRAGEPTTRVWRLAFQVAEESRRHMILQHLLLGMNAHINLDLGIAVAEAAPGDLDACYADFIRVNELLFTLVDRLQQGLESVSPRLAMIDRYGGTWDEAFMKMGIRRARNLAWPFAEHVATAAPHERAERIARRDEEAEWVGQGIARGWSPVQLMGRVIASAETRDVPAIIDTLGAVRVHHSEIGRGVADAVEREPHRSLREAAGRRLNRH